MKCMVKNVKPESLNQSEETFNLFSQIHWSFYLIVACIYAPIVEELILRAGIINMFFKNNLFLGCIISSFLFSIGHSIRNVYDFLAYFTMGLCFSFVYVKTQKLELAIIMHSINNFSVLMQYF